MLKIKNNPTMAGLAEFFPDITYSTATGVDIKMDVIRPWIPEGSEDLRFPLIVFIQGSAWHFPNTCYEIPQLGMLAQSGYVVATVTHRNIDEGHPAPAFLQDVKTAIRHLRTKAAEYYIDPERVYAFGTSSGGNTALLLGLTGDMEEFRTEEYPDVSDHVDAVVECFGPTDLMDFLESIPEEMLQNIPEDNIFRKFCGGKFDPELMQKMSPINYVTPDREYVPFLIAHGDADPIVDIKQSKKMVKRLEECGADVSFVVVEGAEHEGSFWSQHLWEIFKNFLDKQANK